MMYSAEYERITQSSVFPLSKVNFRYSEITLNWLSPSIGYPAWWAVLNNNVLLLNADWLHSRDYPHKPRVWKSLNAPALKRFKYTLVGNFKLNFSINFLVCRELKADCAWNVIDFNGGLLGSKLMTNQLFLDQQTSIKILFKTTPFLELDIL